MGWSVHGTDCRFSFEVDKYGLSVSGEGRPIYRSSLNFFIDTSEIDTLPAYWSIYRASEAAELAASLSLDVQDMKHYLDEAVVKTASKPVGIVNYYDREDGANPKHLFFCAFLPDQYFANIWQLLKLCSSGSDMRYWLRFDFIGFIPHKVENQPPDVISYDEWLAGRPCLSDSFAMRLEPDVRA
jgi:hypothetical protein